MGRDFLKEKGVDTVEDYYTKRGALLNYLTCDWMRFTQDQVARANKNQSKAKTLPLWGGVRKAFLTWSGASQGIVLSPLDKSKANVSHMIKVATGVVRSAAVDQGKTIHTLDEFTEYLRENIKAYGVSVKTNV